ncbi:histamine N-methyltransferase A-like [Stylophora pistillata]|uniref:histamine N-methyltransferase A-like n=1 Tax=Stylophora pistillata TaxID=50429 RepID=UPI000C045293|nr:histamine N-methyltransferase A-like [Stylophora pistillata]
MMSAKGQDRYLAALELSWKTSTARETLANFAEDVAAHTMNNISSLASPTFRVLGVGSGNGKSDLRILNSIATAINSSQKKKPVIHTAIVEPSSVLIQEFKSSLTSLPQPLKSLADVSFEWHRKTFQQFLESLPHEEYFDMIHFVAALYYMDAESSLKGCLQLLANGGAMFCTVGPKKSFFPKLAVKLNTVGVELVKLGLVNKLYTEVDVVEIAQRNNWKYKKLWTVQYNAEITSCFDETSADGALLLDFLTHQENFRANADKMAYKEVMEFLKKECTTDEIGKKFVKPEITSVVIYK